MESLFNLEDGYVNAYERGDTGWRTYLLKDVFHFFDRSFDVEYAHNSTAIEGNTLTLVQIRAILEEGLSSWR
ncbi:hypothetical protein [Frisingicoccus sp.]|uniref:hypothetical protein n=1 Tax=Frisingicoccus sp. TaxID=1918627 RepID=UPI003049ACAE